MIDPTLYIIMRSDIPDMNPGKGMAQAAHAQASFDDWVSNTIVPLSPSNSQLKKAIEEWKENRTFGRTITLEATEIDITNICLSMHSLGKMVVDPTYPWKNWYGKTFLSSEVTCGWVFVYDNWAIHNPDMYKRIKALPLMM